MTLLLNAVKRRGIRPFQHYKSPLVYTFLPGELLQIRELGRRKVTTHDLHKLYVDGLRQEGLRIAAEKRKARKQRRAK